VRLSSLSAFFALSGLNPSIYPDTVILRSAQPNVGWTFGRCASDERLLELAEVRVIIDARPYANAVANQAKGGGYENAENYKDCKIEFMNIENIHVMRESLHKMLETLKLNHLHSYCTGSSTQTGDDFWGAMQQSGWLKHVRILLEGALVCANYVKNGVSILIHCPTRRQCARARATAGWWD
jgi:myotubularin-related protein 6/7/8